MQQRILQKHHQGSCLEYEIDNLYDSRLEGRHIFLSLHALMLLSVLLAYQLILRFQSLRRDPVTLPINRIYASKVNRLI